MRFSSTKFKPAHANLRGRIFGIYGILIAFNVSAWFWAVLTFRASPVLVGTALLAYTLGLRHAVDADHIAAIDNVTRKLVQAGKRPVGVGFMFSLGHSTIVLVGAAAIAAAALTLQDRMDAIRDIGGLIGTLVSAFFLFAIGAVNLVVLRSIYRAFTAVRSGKPYVEEDFDMLLGNRGFLSRLFRPMFQIITESWHMYPLGALFGLGFDTATEIGLLGISAAGASQGMSFISILIFPILFAAGMSLVDTTDSVLMLGAYGWAFVKPVRKLYYNMTITAISVVAAFAVGGIEVLGLLVGRFHLRNGLLIATAQLNDHFGSLGYFIVSLFALCWIISIAIYAWSGFDHTAPIKTRRQVSSD
ncbi:MAG TPA: HoxN/HupN/NixA family nickel/cobalt transporter [Verrucomicrobiae bacterium]|nr:HoxN/HupN/NixA family nickel/cobalt transporter [Verrucomicrobiae bacterium]